MPTRLPSETIDLIERLIEGGLDDEEQIRLIEMARVDPELRKRIALQLEISTALELEARRDEDFASRTALHVARLAEEGEFEFANKVKRTIFRRRVLKGLAAAAVVTLAVIPFLPERAPRGERVALLLRMNHDNNVISSKPVHVGSVITEKEGLYRLDFHNGAIVAIEGPSQVKVVSGMEIEMKSGRLNGWCPDTAHGFRVKTTSAELTDLGTSFGINATPDGRAEFVVLDGLVEVQKGSEKMRLEQGDAIKSGVDQKMHAVTFDPSAFKNTWSFSNGILSTRGSVMPVGPDIAERLVHVESNDHVLVIPERRGVPFNREVRAEITGPGTLPGTINGDVKSIPPVAGKRLSTFLIRYNPVGSFSEENFIRMEGEVTFDRKVLAIACKDGPLAHGDHVFATAEWSSIYRGIELSQRMNPPDSVTLSEDRRTVKIIFYAGASTDDVRVILE
ncbi:MAG: hypothetical protein EOP85_10065, partial [Verrucomicrobiaceae bacterium]